MGGEADGAQRPTEGAVGAESLGFHVAALGVATALFLADPREVGGEPPVERGDGLGGQAVRL